MGITVNITKAKDIAKDNLRAERTPKLAELDIAYMQAQEASEDTSTIVAKKQTLRDITANTELNNATTADGLKATMNSLIDVIKAQ